MTEQLAAPQQRALNHHLRFRPRDDQEILHHGARLNLERALALLILAHLDLTALAEIVHPVEFEGMVMGEGGTAKLETALRRDLRPAYTGTVLEYSKQSEAKKYSEFHG